MTKQQDSYYWRLWDQIRRMHKGKSSKELTEIRHGLHVKALGMNKSHALFSNKDFDLVIGVFKAEYDAGDMSAQLYQMDQEKRRLRWVIEHQFNIPEAYRSQIMMDQFKTNDLMDLNEKQLTHLVYTLSNRHKLLEEERKVPQLVLAQVEAECPF